MPMFTLNRDYPLQGFGHSINFRKGEPTWVPPLLVNAAVAIGAVSEDGPVDVLGPEPEVHVPMTPDERETLLVAAFEQMEARNGDPAFREDFNAQGLPHVKALAKIVGFTPMTKERNELWQKYREQKAG